MRISTHVQHTWILTITGKHIQAHMCTFNKYAHISTCVQHTHLHTEFNNAGTHIQVHTHICNLNAHTTSHVHHTHAHNLIMKTHIYRYALIYM